MTPQERKEHERSPEGKFVRQRYNAIRRGVDWLLTFEEWWTIWQRSGKWHERGNSGYVMARRGDKGPYAVGNVMIIHTSENVSAGPHKKHDLPRGVYWDKRKKNNVYMAYRCIGGKVRRLGYYPTPELAHAAYLAAVPEMEQAA